jgi:hypothetical protein
MTGQKNRFKTTERLWDLDDKQLKTPEHDALVLWLLDKTNVGKIIHFPDTMQFYRDDYSFVDFEIKSEIPLKSNTNFIGGYADIILFALYEDSEGYQRQYNVLIEIKPYIGSFGEVLRQIKSYENFVETTKSYRGQLLNVPISHYCLFTLDSRFDAQFENQGITIFHPPEDVTIDDMLDMYGLR